MKQWILLLSFLAFGCSHLTEWKFFTPLPAPSESQALLYVYHDCSQGRIIGEGKQILVNGIDKAYMPMGSYYGTLVPIGMSRIEVVDAEKKQSLDFELYSKQTIYIKLLMPSSLLSVNISQIDNLIAEKEIEKCRLAKRGYYSSYDAI